MNAIVVVDENWAIGRDGGLLVHLPGDLKYYRQRTLGKVIVVGRKTLESFPGGKPLPERTNIVLTKKKDFAVAGCVVCHSREEVLQRLEEYPSEDVFITGGGEIYREFLQLCDTFYVTKIYDRFDADTYFPNLEEMGFPVTWESPLQREMRQGKEIAYRFLKYGGEKAESR